MKKLNLGSGDDYKEGYVNLDWNPRYRLDVMHDLDVFPYPFEDNEFDEIYTSHVLEHVENLTATLKELERITKPGGIVHIRVPHFSNGYGYSDLSHKRFFGWTSFDGFFNGYLNVDLDFKIIMKRYNFIAYGWKKINKLVSWIFNSLIPPKYYERFLCWIIPVGEIELKLKKGR